ncbi:ribosome biogenesis GTP-binding protein YihA/YsxC [uncultured Dubosiella sp.]|jgi:GTP-binding protein|uniref:ribosome biogenesis GTP-binding protein YihA/YsxC n=1 Tax=uncultured Dubosiella sp. TaxID=1937011 RepID=UPI00208B0E71|nr:ribosome biogenesis GTP-binding protein YihA/YsxC [uncultured Dubosiella sp.]GJM57360.1 putative GTP-binding protein EngB [Erysipelotrichaceae bacterium OPF54]
MKSEFLTSAASRADWPESALPEIVVVGRSNVGKSSFINAFTNRKNLAYVGNTPGKTRLINFFTIDGCWTLVDVPGYGYAKMSKGQLEKLGKMMDDYFLNRKNIAGVIQLVDGRHEPTADDLDMVSFFREMKYPIIVAATKIDKVPKTKRIAAMKKIAQKLQLPLKSICPVSSVEKTGFDKVEELIGEKLEQYKNKAKEESADQN